MSGLEGAGSGVEEAGASGLGLTSSSSAYVRLSSCDTRGWRREGKSEANLKEFSPEIKQRVKCIKESIINMDISEKKMNGSGVCF